MIEPIHLRIVLALHHNGTLTEAANALCLTQSALSHQIRYLEQKLGIALWQREGRRLRLTRAGQLLLEVARQVLPVLDQAEQTLQAYAEGRQGVLRIGVECYPCYEWLTGVITDFLQQMPAVDVDIVHQFQFSGLEGLLNHHIDMLVTPDQVEHANLVYRPLFDYELVLLVNADHPLARETVVTPAMLARETLISFPVPPERLDVFTQFLWPAKVKPAQHKPIESIEIMLQLVAFKRGVCVLPHWLTAKYCRSLPLAALKLGAEGLHKTLYACTRQADRDIPYVQRFIELGIMTAQRGVAR